MNIIINGGTKGIGRELVSIMANDPNNRLVVTGRSSKELAAISGSYQNVKTFMLDLTEFDRQAKAFTDTVSAYLGKVNIMVNMAGALVAKEFMETDMAEGRTIMETNFFGPAAMIRQVKPMMMPGSHIVNISSMGGFQGSIKYRGLSYYSASKAAIACLTECLALEFIEAGISVNCLALGSVQTEMLGEAFPGYKAPVKPDQMAVYINDFARTGHRFFNGKILPVAMSNP